jgi:hypothetical protein
MILGPYDTQSKFHDRVFWAAVVALTVASGVAAYFIGLL